MARTYDEMITLVRNWSNRDIEVLPDAIIQDSLRWAADKAYRRLRIPPLEHTVIYDEAMLLAATSSSNNRFSSVTELQIPADLIEFIQIRETDSEGRTTRLFNEKTDVRTFNDLYSEKYSDIAYWTRFGNCIQLSPGFGSVGTNFGSSGVGNSNAIELYYYRRLPALDSRYAVTLANYIAGLLEDAAGMPLSANADSAQADFDRLPDTTVGAYIPNWLREENERILLMGALAEVFFYLQENEEGQKYAALFTQEISELNDEDRQRTASGGNVQVNFNGRGLI